MTAKGPKFMRISGAPETTERRDFGDLLLHVVTIFQTHADVLQTISALVQIHPGRRISRYQRCAVSMAAAIGGDHKNIFAVLAMMISRSMAGVVPKWAISCSLKRIFPVRQWSAGTKLPLTPHILAAAAGVIRRQRRAAGQKLWTEPRRAKRSG